MNRVEINGVTITGDGANCTEETVTTAFDAVGVLMRHIKAAAADEVVGQDHMAVRLRSEVASELLPMLVRLAIHDRDGKFDTARELVKQLVDEMHEIPGCRTEDVIGPP